MQKHLEFRRNAFDLQLRQVDLEADEQVAQTLSHPWQFPVRSIWDPSAHEQVAAAELYTAVCLQEVQPFGVELMQVRQEEWQVPHWPELVMTELLLQMQAPFTREAPDLQVRHPVGVPLFVRQVSQV